MFIVKLKRIFVKVKNYIIYQIEVQKKLSRGKTSFVEKIGYYDTDPSKKKISIKGDRLGFWLNRGAFLNSSVYKIFKKFLARKK